MSTSVDIVERVDDLAALAPEWEALSRRAFAGGPATSPSWQLAWWRVFGDDRRALCCFAVREDRRLVGLATMLARTHWHFGVLPFRRVELVGSGEDERDEICSEYLGVLAERGREAAVARALVPALRRARRLDELVARSIDGADPFVPALGRELASAGLDVTLRETARAPYVELPSSFEAYLAALPSSHRYLVRRSMRDFDDWAGKTARHRIAQTRDELDEGARILARLHGERWAEREGGAFASPRFRAFHDEVMPALLARGALQLHWLEVRGAPVAAIYNLVADEKVLFYQSGRSLEVPPKIRVGIVLHADAIRRAIEEGRREYDFLGGASRYKLELSTCVRPIVELRAVRRSARERARRLGVRARELWHELQAERASTRGDARA